MSWTLDMCARDIDLASFYDLSGGFWCCMCARDIDLASFYDLSGGLVLCVC